MGAATAILYASRDLGIQALLVDSPFANLEYLLNCYVYLQQQSHQGNCDQTHSPPTIRYKSIPVVCEELYFQPHKLRYLPAQVNRPHFLHKMSDVFYLFS